MVVITYTDHPHQHEELRLATTLYLVVDLGEYQWEVYFLK